MIKKKLFTKFFLFNISVITGLFKKALFSCLFWLVNTLTLNNFLILWAIILIFISLCRPSLYLLNTDLFIYFGVVFFEQCSIKENKISHFYGASKIMRKINSRQKSTRKQLSQTFVHYYSV